MRHGHHSIGSPMSNSQPATVSNGRPQVEAQQSSTSPRKEIIAEASAKMKRIDAGQRGYLESLPLRKWHLGGSPKFLANQFGLSNNGERGLCNSGPLAVCNSGVFYANRNNGRIMGV